MKNEERKGEVLQILGYIEGWEYNLQQIQPYVDVFRRRIEKNLELHDTTISLHVKMKLLATHYDVNTLKTMLKRELCFRISLATEDDEVLQRAKEKLSE